MNIYKVKQDWYYDYDTYDSFVVVAETEQAAREVHPNNKEWWKQEPHKYGYWIAYNDIHRLTVTLIGKASDGIEAGVVVASFNAAG